MKKIAVFCLCFGLFVPSVLAQDILTAVKNGDLEQVKLLLKQNPELIRTKDEYKNSLLRVALLSNDFSLARFLIESGIDLNYEREDIGGNEIINAVDAGSLEITKLIFEKGIDIHLKNKWGYTPLDMAIFNIHKEIAYFLMDKGAALNIQGQGVPRLLRAALTGGMDRITNLLIKEKDIDYKDIDDFGNTFLHSAAQSGETTFIDLLIKNGVDANAGNVYGWTPLHYAASKGHRKMIDSLVRNGADKNIRTKDGKTPFNIAEELGPKDIRPYLREKGLDTGPAEFPKLNAKYIDPDLPGLKPARFAPGIISQPHHFVHSMLSFTEGMKTACWADWQRMGISKIFVMENENGFWQAPRTVQLGATNPFIAPDGKRIYFTAKRTLPEGKESGDNDIFYIERTETGWSDRISLGPNVNSEGDELQPAVTRDGTVYFCNDADIYRARLVDGRYAAKKKLPVPINSETTQGEPYIAPDESFLLFRSLGRGGMGEPNYYFSSRNADDSWTEPVNIAKKIEITGLFPSLTPDRRYMISFLGGGHYWFDISAVMEELANAQKNDFPKPTGPYLGQEPPGLTPEIFAPGVVSSKDHIEMGCAWSPDLKEFYFARSETSEVSSNWAIWCIREEDGVWIEPQIVPFSGVCRDFSPFILPNGKHMIFFRQSNKDDKTRMGSWIVDRKGRTWSEPRFFHEAYCLKTSDFRTFYFTTDESKETSTDIGLMNFGNGVFSEPVKVPGQLNTAEWEAHGFISPDGSYMLFDRKKSSFVSFLRDDKTWSRGYDLGRRYFVPAISPDGKYIFFESDGDICWVDAKIIDKRKLKEYK